MNNQGTSGGKTKLPLLEGGRQRTHQEKGKRKLLKSTSLFGILGGKRAKTRSNKAVWPEKITEKILKYKRRGIQAGGPDIQKGPAGVVRWITA